MKNRDGGVRDAGGGSGRAPDFKRKKQRLGGKGLSLEAFVGAKKIKPVVTASQIRKQREAYQNSKKVNKYRKTLKHLAEEGHEFKPLVPLVIDAETTGQDVSEPVIKDHKKKLSSLASEREHLSIDTDENSKERDQVEGHGKKSGKGRRPKPQSQLERLRAEYEEKKRDEEEKRKERQALFEEQQAAREKAKKERKEVQNKFRKFTGKGQPVMKHRMEHLLESIQRDMKS